MSILPHMPAQRITTEKLFATDPERKILRASAIGRHLLFYAVGALIMAEESIALVLQGGALEAYQDRAFEALASMVILLNGSRGLARSMTRLSANPASFFGTIFVDARASLA